MKQTTKCLLTCENCIFSQLFQYTDHQLKCHRYPPVHISELGFSRFPYVVPTDFCGEFRPKEDQ